MGRDWTRFVEGVIVVALLSAVVLGCGNSERKIVISQSQIQGVIAPHFPIEKNLMIATVQLLNPRVYLTGQQIGLKITYRSALLNRQLEGEADVRGQVRYEPTQGAFYLSGLQIAELTTTKGELSDKEQLINMILPYVRGYVEQYPVYQLNPADYKQNLAKVLMKDVRVEGQGLVITLSI